jgi:hypothetical protein
VGPSNTLGSSWLTLTISLCSCVVIVKCGGSGGGGGGGRSSDDGCGGAGMEAGGGGRAIRKLQNYSRKDGLSNLMDIRSGQKKTQQIKLQLVK